MQRGSGPREEVGGAGGGGEGTEGHSLPPRAMNPAKAAERCRTEKREAGAAAKEAVCTDS